MWVRCSDCLRLLVDLIIPCVSVSLLENKPTVMLDPQNDGDIFFCWGYRVYPSSPNWTLCQTDWTTSGRHGWEASWGFRITRWYTDLYVSQRNRVRSRWTDEDLNPDMSQYEVLVLALDACGAAGSWTGPHQFLNSWRKLSSNVWVSSGT